MDKISCLIIDDEALARSLIVSYLKENEKFQVAGEGRDGFEGLKLIQEIKPDLVFVDVQMPKVSGLEMLELIEDPPIVVFTTAYQEHAVRAFDLNAIDYLLKPFSKERFLQSLDKAERLLHNRIENRKQVKALAALPPEQPLQRVVVRTVHSIKVIPVEQIRYLEAQDDYVMVHCKEGKFLKQQTMKYFEEALDVGMFIRIHRSFMVNIHEVLKIEPMDKSSYVMLLKDNIRLPISRSGYSLLKQVLDF